MHGRTTILCPVSGKPQAKITWLKGGKPLDDATDIYLSNNRQRLHFRKLQKVGSHTIYNSLKSHADKYTCIAKNSAGEDKRDFVLRLLGKPLSCYVNRRILEEPKIDTENLLREVQVNAGRTSSLSCPVNSGFPEPNIKFVY